MEANEVTLTALGFKATIQKRNTAWIENINTICSDKENMQPLEDIDSQTVERYYYNYTKSNGDLKYRIVVLGVWTIDLK